MAQTIDPSFGRRPFLTGGLGMILAESLGCDRNGPKKLYRVARGVVALAVDGPRLCWVTGPEHGKLYVASRDEGSPICRHHNIEWARDLEVFGEHGYLAVGTGVLRGRLDGGPLVELARQAKGAQRLAVDRSGVFWLERQTGAVWSMAHDGGGMRQLAVGPTWSNAIAVDDHHVYWTAGEDGLLQRVPKTGGEAVVLHRSEVPLTDLARDGERLFWCEPTAVMGMPLVGGSPTIVAPDQVAPCGLVVSPSALAWVNASNDSQAGAADVMVMSNRVGAMAQTLTRRTIPQVLALTGNTLYWSDHAQGGIMRAVV